MHDISNPENLVQVAYYDSYTGEKSGTHIDLMDVGERNFLPSGNIISSDINSGVNGNGRLLVYERGFTSVLFRGYVQMVIQD